MARNAKKKTVFVDDGRTLADMSGVKRSPQAGANPSRPPIKAKDAWHTYWQAVKMMFLPMLAVIGALVVIYAVIYLLLSLA